MDKMKTKFNEDTLSEQPAIEQLKRFEYEYIHGDNLDPELNDDSEREANQKFHQDLIAGISIDQDIGARRQKQTVRFIDFENPEKNEFLIVNQFWVKGPKQTDRPDIVIFINGIPLVVIECKSPVAKNMGISNAVVQLKRYQDEIPQLFYYNQICIALNLFGARYGTILSDEEFYHEWKDQGNEKFPNMAYHPTIKEMLRLELIQDEDLSDNPTAQEVLIAGILSKRNLLDIIRNFIVFELERAKTVKKVCRYQQFTTVNKIIKRVTAEDEKRGIVWHWQGSGKSLTMLFAAVKLRREEKTLKNPIILIVTDRIDLDDQISKTFRNCNFPNPIQIREKGGTHRRLYELLSRDIGHTLLTTIFLFRKQPDKPLSEAENIIVLTDEAHRTQYGFYALNMRRALPNASFFAFTGTPLDKRDRNTYRHFSPPGERYLDSYTIINAEDDRQIVPVKYESRMARLQVVGKTLDQLFDDLFHDKTEDEKALLKRRYGNIQTLSKAGRRIELVARDIVEHFNQKIRPNGFKAQLVASDRATAIQYKQELDKLIDPERSEVVITVNNDDPRDWKEKYRRTREQENLLKEAFNDPDDPLEFLIVCDKLLTGFDAPIEQVMYLDHGLKEHTLLQAIARTNRTYPRKNFGLVVDYVGVGRDLARALSVFDKEDLEGIFGIDDIKKELANLDYWHKKALGFFRKTDLRKGKPENILQKCMEILKPEDVRAEFDVAFREFARSMDFLMPDPAVDPFLEDFKLLGSIREGARNLYRDERLNLKDCSKKVEKLIHAHITSTGIKNVLEPIRITAPDFNEKLEIKGSTRAKASHVEYAIRQSITEKAATDPAFYGSLKERLEKIIEDHRKEREDEAMLLKELIALGDREKERETFAKSLGLSDAREFSFYGLLHSFRESMFSNSDEKQVAFTKEVIQVIRDKSVIDWADKEDVQKEMRREIKKLLRSRTCPEAKIDPLAREILSLARIQFKDV
jgi:type I restriction enzyme R subunit